MTVRRMPNRPLSKLSPPLLILLLSAVLLLPGFGTDVSVFARQIPELARAYRVIGVNPRGVGLSEAPEQESYDNAFKVQWEMFLKHVVMDHPFPFSLLEGAKGVQLAEKGLESWEKRAWVEVEDLKG